MGAWIEIQSLCSDGRAVNVAPLVGAWIEINVHIVRIEEVKVAPLVGAWIEIVLNVSQTGADESLPSWERGLKFFQNNR